MSGLGMVLETKIFTDYNWDTWEEKEVNFNFFGSVRETEISFNKMCSIFLYQNEGITKYIFSVSWLDVL